MTNKMPPVIYAGTYAHQDDGSLMVDAEITPYEGYKKYIDDDLVQPLLDALKYAHGQMQPFCDDSMVKKALRQYEEAVK